VPELVVELAVFWIETDLNLSNNIKNKYKRINMHIFGFGLIYNSK